MEHSQSLEAATLLAHADWIRALARTLVTDESLADDLVQNTWLAAHSKPPRDARNLRAWLAEVARNLARFNARSEARRAHRERIYSRPESLPDTADLVAQAELQREIVGHVLGLDELYRTVILLRFFRGLDVQQIAILQNVPANTVRTRLQRALAILRTRLDSEWGNRSGWCAPVTAIASPARHSAWPATLGVLAATAWKIAAAVVIAGLGVWWYRSGALDVAPRSASVVDRDESQPTRPVQVSSDEPPPTDKGSREPAFIGASKAASEKRAALTVPTIIEGRVVDVCGVPMPKLQIWAPSNGPPQSVATTDAMGSFQLEARSPLVELIFVGGQWTLVSDGWREQPREHIYIVAPAVDVAGTVRDSTGVPAPDAFVRRSVSRRGLREFPWTLDGGFDDYSRQARTTSDGRFHLSRVPVVLGERIIAYREGEAESGSVLVPERSRNDLVITLAPPRRERRPHIRGLVLDAAGRAILGAHVNFSNDETVSDANGRFELVVSNYDTETALSATMAGEIAAVIDGFGSEVRRAQQDADEPSIDGVLLQLGGPALTISGRVLDAAGTPCAGWRVDLQDRTPLGNSSMSLEGVTAGHQTDHDFPITDAQGKFTVEGLRNRSYRLRAWDEHTCLTLVSEPVSAGRKDVQLCVPPDAIRARIHGRVVSSRREPVPGARVALSRVRVRMRSTLNFASCFEVVTDSEGRFEFLNVPRREMWIVVSGVHIDGSPTQPIAADGGDEPRELVVMFLCRVHVVLDPTDLADAYEVLDGSGKRLDVLAQTSSSINSEDHVRRGADGFPVCKISDTARTLVLYRGQTELRRVPIELHAGDLQVITP
jgi:RNA polymerase sigma-70 factor (ECF subfamily)